MLRSVGSALAVVLYCTGVLAGDGVPAVDFESRFEVAADPAALIEQLPPEATVVYATGQVEQVDSQAVWRFMCGSEVADGDLTLLKDVAVQARQAEFAQKQSDLIGVGRAAAGPGLDIVWNNVGGVTPDAAAALEAVAVYVEGQFGDPITVVINVQMFNFGNPNVIGSTGSNYLNTTYTATRTGLVDGMDGNDLVQNLLPLGSTLPVRYDGTSATVTNENRVFITTANYNATIGSSAGAGASMQFNTGFAFDYDPANGVPGNQMCFRSVAAHELGHALGFTSGVDFRFNDLEMLDLFRFQNTDGSGDYNPDDDAEFQTRPRTVSYDSPNDDAISDIVSSEWRMEDGTPNQASHFKTTVAAIMDPNLSYGETFYPDFYRSPDLQMFDAIGWDYPKLVVLPATDPTFPDNAWKNRYISFVPASDGESVAYQVELTSGLGTPGVLGWVGPPNANGVSLVTSTFAPRVWTEPVVHVTGCEIAPTCQYVLRATPDGTTFSLDLPLGTIPQLFDGRNWGDVVGSFDSGAQEWGWPDGTVNGFDIVAIVQKFQQKPEAPPMTWADLNPVVPDYLANGADILQVVNAFSLGPYPFPAPSACP